MERTGHHAFFYEVNGCQEQNQQHDRLTSASAVNFEAGTLRTFFYSSINYHEIKREPLPTGINL
jgi:hypothetical protein